MKNKPMHHLWGALSIAMLVSAVFSPLASGFEEVKLDGVLVGERGSYVVRNGVPSWLPPGAQNGHAGLLTAVSEDQKGILVYEIRGGGLVVQLSNFSQADTWTHPNPPPNTDTTGSFLDTENNPGNLFMGCGHPPYCDGLSSDENKAYRDQVDVQAWRALGQPYVNPIFEITSLWEYGLDPLSSGVTRITNGEPDIPDRFRCDGLVEWAYESARAVVTGLTGTQDVDSRWGVYKINAGAWAFPSGLWAPPKNDGFVQTSASAATFPSMKGAEGKAGHVPKPTINPATKTYSVTWSAPDDPSGIFHYAYGWIPTVSSWGNYSSLSNTTSTSVKNDPMPNQPGTYRFVVMAMDRLGHWSGTAGTFEGEPQQWPPSTAAPTILTHPASQTAYAGQSVTFSVSASGVAPLTYQWIEGVVEIPGATGSTLTIPNVTAADTGRSFSVRVTNPQGFATSSSAVLTVSTSSDTEEPNESSLTGTPLPMGTSRNGYISSPTDQDWFKVVVDKTGLLSVALTVPSGLDYDVEIYGPDYLWKSGSYGLAGQNERIDLSLLQAGTYYVRVYGYPLGAGAYDANRPYQLSASLAVAASGVIDTAVTWAETVELTGDVVIGPGGSLTIMPGTQIRIPKSDDQAGGNNINITEIIVNGGTLTALGTQGSPIIFTSSRSPKTAGDWYGIRVKGGNVSLQHCVVEYAAEGIRFEDIDTRFETYALSDVTVRYCSGTGVWMTSGQYAQTVTLNNFKVIGNGVGIRAEGPVTMAGGEVKGNNGHGIVYYNTVLVMNGVTVMANTGKGILGEYSGRATLTDCLVTFNGSNGVEFSYSSPVQMSRCTVSHNSGWGLYGYWYYSGTAEFSDNIIQSNQSGGIELHGSVTVGLVGNTISGNTGNGLGLDIYRNNDQNGGISASGITGNSIFGNGGVGVRVTGNQPTILTLSGNDIYNNTGFELRNDGSCTVVADGNYWGTPTNTELAQGASNLTRIYDLRDGASRAVLLTDWYGASVVGGSPGSLQNYNYPAPGVTQTVSGTISGSQTWGGKVLVVGDVRVTGSLTINPGTEVIFEYLHDTQTGGQDTSRSELIVEGGSLNATGTTELPILFTSSRSPKTAGDWYGIRVRSGTVTLGNCTVEYAAEGIRFEDADTRFESYALSDVTVRYCSGTGVWMTSGQYAQTVTLNNFKVIGNGVGIRAEGPVTMAGGEVKGNNGHGIVYYNTVLVMNGVTVMANTGKGILGEYSGRATLTDCLVTFNGSNGVEFSYSSPVQMSRCTVSHNSGWGLYGYWYYSGTAEFSDNIIQSNQSGGIELHGSVTVGLVGNTISGNTGNGLGLDIYRNNDQNGGISASGITGNSIFGNGGVGVRVTGNQPTILTLSGNDIYNNTGFELRNDGSCTVVADGNYWGTPTNTELAQGASNLTRIYDLRDGASKQVQIGNWYASSFESGDPGPRIDFTYGVTNITRIVVGDLLTDQTWSGRVLVVGDLTIRANLMIDPGTEIIVVSQNDAQTGGQDTSRSELIVEGGSLNATGTTELPILFTSSRSPKTAGDWYGIRVRSGTVTLGNCTVEYAAEGIRFEDADTRFESYALSDVTVRYCSGTGVWMTSGQYAQTVTLNNFKVIGNGVGIRAEGPVTMAGGEVKGNNGHGIVYYNTVLVMNGVTVMANTGKGILGEYSGRATLTDCLVTFNGSNGVEFSYSSPVQMSRCTVSHNSGWGLYGYWYYSGTAEFSDNIIQSNQSGGIELHGSVTVGLVGNTISGNTGNGLGLDIYRNNDQNGGISASGITGNSIFGNGGVGVRVTGNQPTILTLSGNDIYNNTGFELRNDGSCTVVADGNYWGTPTNTELAQGASNLTRIYDLRDGASRAVLLTDWYGASVVGGSPGSLQNYNYPAPGVTQTVSGTISGSQTWGGKVLVVGDVRVTGSLTINPGTEVIFEYLHDTQTGGQDTSRSELIVEGGSLNATGTTELPILFTSSRSPKTAGDWYGIRVRSGTVTLGNCTVEYAAEGIRFEDADTRFESYALSDVTVRYCSGTGVWMTSGQYAQTVTLNNFKVIGNGVGIRAEGPVTMAGGEVKGNNGHGIVYYNTVLVMNGVTVMANTGKGILGEYSGRATLTDCLVTFNGSNGVEFSYSSPVQMSRCTVSHNSGWGLYGYWYYSGTAEFSDNIIQSNQSGGIELHGSVTVGLVGNTISGNTGNGLGLDIYRNNDQNGGISASGITGNSIFGNGGVGVRVTGNQPTILTLSGNDIYNNTGFELRNESGISITAENIYLGKETASEFGKQDNLTRIYDQHDHPSYGQVIVQSLNPDTMIQPPVITVQPQSMDVAAGDTVTLSVTTTGAPPITYQWYRNRRAVAQATNRDLVLTNMTASKAGDYYVVATNKDGQATSVTVQVLLILPAEPPVITSSSTASGTVGALFGGYTITADIVPDSYSALNLPEGLVIDSSSGVISGTPLAAGTFQSTIGATSLGATGTVGLTFTIAKGNATVTLGNLLATYDGTAKLASATTNPSNLGVTFTYNGSATVPTAAGSYSVVATISDANYQGSATDTLVIANSQDGLGGFRTANGLDTGGTHDLLAPAGDGVPNLLKYAFNMLGNGQAQEAALNIPNNQTVGDSGTAGLPSTKIDGSGKLTTTYIRRKASSNPGISYSVEYSNDLSPTSWEANASATESATSINDDFERVTVTDSTGITGGKRFLRVKVSLP